MALAVVALGACCVPRAVHAQTGGDATSVQSALKQAQREAAEGLTTESRLEFGDTDDWIELKTGEWLRGDLRWLRPKGLEAGQNLNFYSNKLDSLTLSWGSIAGVHSPKIKSYTFKDKVKVSGKAMITKDAVIIENDQGIKTYPRAELLSISEGPPRERTWWSTMLSLGFSANAGNTSQGSLTTQWSLMRMDGHTLGGLRYNGTVAYTDGELNVNRHLGDVNTALFLWDRVYLIPIAGQLLYDAFQNIKLRATPSTGAGVYLFKKTRQRKKHTNQFEWDLQSGLGYQFLGFLSTPTGATNPQSDGFILLRTHWKLEFLNDNVELTIDWRTNLAYTNFGSTNHTGTVDVSVEITDRFSFLTTFLFLRTRDPQPRADGTVPKENDYQIVVSIALKIN
ncbi:MAG TPA: DUF481 domain-containing protein [Polyangiales bacterium]|nr:DUF481 domain-containing protein [Polyangiales bacterium]